MSRCDLTIELDRPSPQPYHPGDRVSGRVHVRVNKNCRCDALNLELFWRTHGRGNQATGDAASMVLFEGDWQTGEQIVHDFSFEPLPEGPYTYHGHYLNVDWYVRVTADIPWAFDPEAEEELLLTPGETTADHEVEDHDPEGERAEQLETLRYLGYAGAGCLTLALVLLAGGLLWWNDDQLLLFVLAVVFGGIGGYLLWISLARYLAEQKLGPVVVALGPRHCWPSGRITCSTAFQPTQAIRLNGIFATLRCTESVTSGSGTNETTHTKTVSEERFSLCEDRTLTPGEATMLKTQLTVPDHAPYTFSAPDNELCWEVELRIDIPRWPDWTQEYDITVAP